MSQISSQIFAMSQVPLQIFAMSQISLQIFAIFALSQISLQIFVMSNILSHTLSHSLHILWREIFQKLKGLFGFQPSHSTNMYTQVDRRIESACFFFYAITRCTRSTPDSTHSPKNVTQEKRLSRWATKSRSAFTNFIVYKVQLAVHIVME